MTPLVIEQSKALFQEVEKDIERISGGCCRTRDFWGKKQGGIRGSCMAIEGGVEEAMVKLRELWNHFTTAVTVDSR